MKLSIGFLLALSAWGGITNAHVDGVTAQQVIISFNVPNPNLCYVQVALDVNIFTYADDTNPTLFPLSTECASRPSTIINGTKVTLVLGKRTSELATDGRLHSRSLAVASSYYVFLSDEGLGGGSVVVSVTTANIPYGDTHPESTPFNANGFGNWAMPDLDWTDGGVSTWYVDPVSGLQFRRIPRDEFGGGGGGDGNDFHPFYKFTFGGVFDVTKEQTTTATWTNLSNALNTSTAGPFASYTGTNRDALFFAPDRTGGQNIPYSTWYSQDDLQFNAYGSAPGCTGEDCKILVCLAAKYNPQTNLCTSPELEIVLPTSAGEVDAPSSYPTYQYAGWNVGRSLKSEEWGIWGNKNSFVQSGYPNDITVTGSSGTLTIGADGDTLLPQWAAPGMKMNINGTWYTLNASPTSASFTLQEGGVNTVGKWYMGNFGVRVRKKTTNNNSINLAASFMVAHVRQPRIDAGSEKPWCNNSDFALSIAADGITTIPTKRARLCMIGDYPDFTQLLMIADDGEIRYLSPLKFNGLYIPLGLFSPTDPFTIYASGNDNSNPAYQALYSLVYTPSAGCNYKTWTGNKYATITPPSDCMVATNITPSASAKSVTEQIAAQVQSNPVWDPTWTDALCGGSGGVGAKCFNFTAITGNYAWYSAGSKEGVQWQADFDLTTGNLVKIVDTFSNTIQGLNFAGIHSGGGSAGPNFKWIEFETKVLYGGGGWHYLNGPWVLPASGVDKKSTDGITYTTDTSLTANSPYGWTCGTNPQGITGAQCVWLHVTTDQACDMDSNNTFSTEVTRWPCSWHSGWTAGPRVIQADTYFGLYNGGIDGKGEKMRILTKTSDGSTGWYLMVQRHATCDNPTGDFNGTPPAIPNFRAADNKTPFPNGWQMYISPPYACDTLTTWVDSSADLAHTVTPPYVNLSFQHGGGGQAPNQVNDTEGGQGLFRTAPFSSLPTTSNHITQNVTDVAWNGVNNGDSTGPMEIYTSINNRAAPSTLLRSIYLEARHMNPTGGNYSEKNNQTLYNQTYSLVPFTNYVYKLTSGQFGFGTDQKLWRPVTMGTTFLWQDISSPLTGNQITDTTPWASCYAYKNNECRAGSTAGDYFVWAKNLWMERGGCVISTFKNSNPCTLALWPQSGYIIQSTTQQNDDVGSHFRRYTTGLVSPMSWYQLQSPHPTPDYKFMFVRSAYINGVDDRPLLFKMPPPPTDDTVDRSGPVKVTVKLPTGSGYARILFGYQENGLASQFFCTSRQETCSTDASVSPFAYTSSDSLTAKDCRTGCSIDIPALAGRVVFYKLQKCVDAGCSTGAASGQMMAQAVQ